MYATIYEMRVPPLFCLSFALLSVSCGGSQKWVSNVDAPLSPSTDPSISLPSEQPTDASEYQPWGAVRPRLAEVVTLGESEFPAAVASESTNVNAGSQSAGNAPTVVHINNYTATPTVWPVYGPVWGVNSFYSSRCVNCRSDGVHHAKHFQMRTGPSSSASVPPVGSSWPASSHAGPSGASAGPAQNAAPKSDVATKTPAQRVGGTTCASCVTTGR